MVELLARGVVRHPYVVADVTGEAVVRSVDNEEGEVRAAELRAELRVGAAMESGTSAVAMRAAAVTAAAMRG